MNKHIKRLNKKTAKALSVRQIAYESLGDDNALLTDTLVEQDLLEPSAANVILEDTTGFTSIDPTFVSFNIDFLKHAKSLIPGSVAIKENVFLLKHEGNYVHLVMALPDDEACIKRMEFITGARIERQNHHSLRHLKRTEHRTCEYFHSRRPGGIQIERHYADQLHL